MDVKETGKNLWRWIRKVRYPYPTKQSIDLARFLDKRDALRQSFGAHRGLGKILPLARLSGDFLATAVSTGLYKRFGREYWALSREAYAQVFRSQVDDQAFARLLFPEMDRMNRFRRSDLVVCYRFYEKNGTKPRPAGFDKYACFSMVARLFADIPLYVFIDHSSQEAADRLQAIRPDATLFQVRLGNSKNLLASLDLATTLPDHTIVYFVEDDYIHLPGSDRLILEAFNSSLSFDYLTLYDHPDKYVDGYNPLVEGGGELSRVYFTGSAHWKETNSTTMTFAATVKTIKADKGVFERFCKGGIPNDFRMYRFLKKVRHRRLISSIPGYASHCETGAETPLLPEGTFQP
jgi:hypothetical protein